MFESPREGQALREVRCEKCGFNERVSREKSADGVFVWRCPICHETVIESSGTPTKPNLDA